MTIESNLKTRYLTLLKQAHIDNQMIMHETPMYLKHCTTRLKNTVKKINMNTLTLIDVAICHQEKGYMPHPDFYSSLIVINDDEALQYLDYYDKKWGVTNLSTMLREVYSDN